MKKLLIVDDIEEYLNSLARVLSDEYTVLKARNLEDAKRKAKEGIDVAVVDIRLSEDEPENKDGLVFLEWMRMNYPDVPVIMMSAYKEFDLAVESLNLGAKYFLKKPISIKELKGTIKTLLNE